MARIWRHRSAIGGALASLAALFLAPALAQDQNAGKDLYGAPVLVVDPGMHTAPITSLAVDRAGQIAVTGSEDRTVRIWSTADGSLQRTIWMPIGPDTIGAIYAVALNPDGSTIAAGGFTETDGWEHPIYVFNREGGTMIRRINKDVTDIVHALAFSPNGRYLAATLGSGGLRIFDRDAEWGEAYRDDAYRGPSFGAAFALNGRLATTSWDGMIRLYSYDRNSGSPNFRPVGQPLQAPSGKSPDGIAFSPDSMRLAVGYADAAAVDLLDGRSLERLPGPNLVKVDPESSGLDHVAWSPNGDTLSAIGSIPDGMLPVFVTWDQTGFRRERRLGYCGQDAGSGIAVLSGGRVLIAGAAPCLCLVGLKEQTGTWTVPSPLPDFRLQRNSLKISDNGKVVDFGFGERAGGWLQLHQGVVRTSPNGELYFDIAEAPGTPLRFDVSSLRLSRGPFKDGLTTAPNHKGLSGRKAPLERGEVLRSVAAAPDSKRFYIGSNYTLSALDISSATRWRRWTQGEVWAVNASRDGRVLVAAEGDGTIRWYSADDGRELLALEVLPNKTDWVLWAPEGFYQATQGAQDVLKWVVNHGPENAATTSPVSKITELNRPDALPRVIDTLDPALAVGVANAASLRLVVQKATGSAKPPGGVLHVLAIGIDKFGDNAGGLHLDYAAEDAHDVASMLLESQKYAPGKASLYADVSVQYLLNGQATQTAILDQLDIMARNMRTSRPDQSLAVILISSHGEMIDGQFYLIPSGFDAGSLNKMTSSAISASEFARKVQAIAKDGKVLLLLDACHSGAVAAGGWAKDPDAKVLQDAMDMANVTVLTSSKENEQSQELSKWKHGAFTKAFLDALSGAADPEGRGVIKLSALASAMYAELPTLTRDQQHLGLHVNFEGDLFVVTR